MTVGPIPEGSQVLHHCDNTKCVNPVHLFLGTRSDNMRDMVAKGRHRPGDGAPVYGERNGNSKLKVEQVVAIREALLHGERLTAIAAKYGVTPPLISLIRDNRIWRDT